jgi:hypothetical protein
MMFVAILTLALPLAGCGNSWDKLDGKWQCDANETSKMTKTNGAAPNSLDAAAGALATNLACSNLSLTIDTKAKVVNSTAYEPAESGGELLMKLQNGQVMRFKMVNGDTALLVVPELSTSFVLKKR